MTAIHAHMPAGGPERGLVAPSPVELYLEVTNRCNLRCTTCPQSWGMQEPFHDLPWERFLAVVQQAPALRRAVLHGIGEPLLHPELARMIRHLKERGVFVLFNSNGLLLRGARAAALLDSGLDELRISIDGGSPEAYRAVRGVDGYSRIFANVRRFAALKAARGLDTPRLSLWMSGMKLTIGTLPALVRQAAAAGIAEVYLQRLVYSERGNATSAQALWGRAGQPELAALAEAEGLAREMGIRLSGSGELGPAALLDGADHPADAAPWRGCYRPWRLMYVTATGNVLPCCVAPFTSAPYRSLVLGNVRRQSLIDIWEGAAYQRWRSAMLAGEPPAACRDCGAGWSL